MNFSPFVVDLLRCWRLCHVCHQEDLQGSQSQGSHVDSPPLPSRYNDQLCSALLQRSLLKPHRPLRYVDRDQKSTAIDPIIVRRDLFPDGYSTDPTPSSSSATPSLPLVPVRPLASEEPEEDIKERPDRVDEKHVMVEVLVSELTSAVDWDASESSSSSSSSSDPASSSPPHALADDHESVLSPRKKRRTE